MTDLMVMVLIYLENEYSLFQVPVPPILGCYQLIEEGSQLKITVNLKLHESIKNSFEYCEARIPFFNR